ncbi:MAG: CapA family protein [Oscillospiraceae bacterium]|nr:CapA family protein [Oscillospiraceae bacterium]
MSLDHDELNRRRQDREKRRIRRQRMMYVRLVLAAVVLIACGVGIFFLIRNNEPASTTTLATVPEEIAPATEEETTPPTEKRPSWEKAPVKIHIAAGGDLNVTDKVVWSGQMSGDFNYTNAFMDVAPILSQADLAILNFEGNVCGAPYGTETGSAPQPLLEALKNAGVDVLQMANSCSIRNGLMGLTSTLSNIRAAGLEPVGAFSSADEFRKTKGYTICQVGDIKIALVAFTKGVGSLGLPVGSEDCVNLLYEDYYTTYQTINKKGIRNILRAAEAEKPDLTIALLHWGSEYNEAISKSQEDIAKLMIGEGVDVIIGSHPHLVQQIDFDEANGTIVAYSLGDFFGDGERGGTNYAIILDIEVTKDYETGTTKVTDYSYVPIYTLAENQCDGFRRVVRIENAMSAYELNFVDKVTDSCYENMKFAMERILARVHPEKQTDKSK